MLGLGEGFEGGLIVPAVAETEEEGFKEEESEEIREDLE
jgi:hypothetical protein